MSKPMKVVGLATLICVASLSKSVAPIWWV